MVVLAYDNAEILRRLNGLSHNHRLAFGASCCERLFGNYVAFKKEVQWGNEIPLRQSLDKIWDIASGEATSLEEIARLGEACESVAPDADDFDSLLTASAQDCVFAICYVLDYIRDGNIEELARSSSYPVDTVDLYVQEIEGMVPNSEGLEDRIRQHELMQHEIVRQHNDLTMLENADGINVVKQHAQASTQSNIGL